MDADNEKQNTVEGKCNIIQAISKFSIQDHRRFTKNVNMSYIRGPRLSYEQIMAALLSSLDKEGDSGTYPP